MNQGEPGRSAASLVDALLVAEADREAAQQASARVDDGPMVGVGSEAVPFKDAIRTGGPFTFFVLLVMGAFENLESAALTVLAPDLRESFHVKDGVIVFITSAAGAFMILGAMPMGWLADRYKRSRIAAIAGVMFGIMVFLSGMAVNAFTFFLARFGVGVARSSTIPVHGSLMADTYPIGARGRLSATSMGAGLAIGALSPALVGLIAKAAGGVNGWRWVFYLLGLPVLLVALLAFKIKEPARGKQEMMAVLGEVVDSTPTSISVEAAFSRLKQIATLRAAWAAFAALGFGLFTSPVMASLYLERHFHLDSLQRGVLGSVGSVGVLFALPFAAKRYDAKFRTDPAGALKLVGILILPVAIAVPIQYAMPTSFLFTIAGVVPQMLLMTAFTMVGPIMQSVTPYRLRGMGSALGSLYVFLIGATGGALLSGLIVDSSGPKTAVLVIMIPSTIVGALLLMRGSMLIKGDLAAVTREIEEEKAEFVRRTANPDALPALQVSGIDFAYGNVQVLFDVNFEVRKGEVFALLGTNGAGKSTILRAIAGLGTPSRGVVRLHGQTITFASPEKRGPLGLRLLAGGKGVFPGMTVKENLEVAGFPYRDDAADLTRRHDRVMGLFPELETRLDVNAGSLSGGQQQMLALAGILLHDPEILLIDELSLGLAPLVVQRLLQVVEQLKAEGKTIVIVEQSLNVALSVADRAVFLEKGRVQFEGDAKDLLERGDLVRAVFLGTESAGG